MMIRNLALLFCLSLLPACSVIQATSGPEMKDMSVLDRGTERYKVLAELDRPMPKCIAGPELLANMAVMATMGIC